ncbi:MAG: cytochrome P450, partial [Gammaproteobacteria bacterium]
FRDVLVTHGDCFTKQSSAFARLALVLGRGLLTTDGEEWRRHRRMIQPAFHKPRLAAYAPMMVEEAARAADGWRAGETFDLGGAMAATTLRVVSRALFSHEVAQDVNAITGAVAVLQDGFSRLDLLPRWLPTPRRLRARRALGAIDAVMYRLIAARRALEASTADVPDLLQMLLDARDAEGDGAGLTDTEIRDQLVTFYLAGHETTSHALTWTLYLLSQHPEVEARLYAELETVLGDRDPTFADVDALVYAERVVRESMRLYPPVFAIARKTAGAARIGEYTVPAGSEVALWFYFAHRDERWFPDPERFDPERFAEGGGAERHRHAYLPFGGGARTCIGKTFATIEAVLILATLVRRWRLRLAPGHPVDVQTRVTLMPRYGMKMVAERR